MQHVIYAIIACESYDNHGIDYALQYGGLQIYPKSIQYAIYPPFAIWSPLSHPMPFLPPLQLRYMPNDLMTIRRPQPSTSIYANSVMKEELGKMEKFAGFNLAHYFQKCAISRTPTKSTKYFNICIPRPPRSPLDLPSTPPRPPLDHFLNPPLNIPPKSLPIPCNEKGLILIYGAN